jgi:hypothetical protein
MAAVLSRNGVCASDDDGIRSVLAVARLCKAESLTTCVQSPGSNVDRRLHTDGIEVGGDCAVRIPDGAWRQVNAAMLTRQIEISSQT